MANTTGVRFRQAGKIFYYDAGDFEVDQPAATSSSRPRTGSPSAASSITPDQVIANEGSSAGRRQARPPPRDR